MFLTVSYVRVQHVNLHTPDTINSDKFTQNIVIEEIKNQYAALSSHFSTDKRMSLVLDILAAFVICVFCYVIFFQGLGEYSVRMWDEARLGINAIEMLRNSNFVVTHYKGVPEMWNTKPPLFIWLITLSFKLFGVNELSLRLPSAAAASLTALIMYFFLSKILKDKITGFLACLILFSAFGFSDVHIGRSGDYDAVLTLFVFTSLIFTFLFLDQQKNKYLFVASIMWTLATMTKGIAAMLVTPAILLYVLITKKLGIVFGNRNLLWAAAMFLGMVGTYYIGRESINAGYLNAVWYEEIFSRSTINNEGGTNPYLYYWNWLVTFRFQHFVYFVPFSIAAYFLVKEKKYKNWILFSYLIVATYYFVISTARGKNLWYDAQLYPFASLLVAILITSLIRKIPTPFWLIPIVVLSFYLQRYIRTNIAYIQRPDIEKPNSCLKYGYLFRQKSFDKKTIVGVHNHSEFCMPFIFYMEKENVQMKEVKELVLSDMVLTCDGDVIADIEKIYKTKKVFESEDGCYLLKLDKQPASEL